MSELPDDIADCETDQERALWLLRCPLHLLSREEPHLRRWLRLSGFQAGVSYLETELSFLREPRRDDGQPLNGMAIAVARGRMSRIAEGLEPYPWGNP